MVATPGRSAPLRPADAADELDPETYLRTAMLDAIGEAVIATDLEGHILYWNDAATRLYGWRADEVIGANVLEVTAASMGEEAASIMDRLRAGESWSGEFLVTHRDGHTFPALVTDTAVRDASGRIVAIVGVSRDVSGKWAAQETAREAEQRIEMVGRAAATAIWEWDIPTDRIRWSASTGSAFGYDTDQVDPAWGWWTGRIHPEDRARVIEGFREFMDGGGHYWTDEYRFLTGDRGYAHVFDRAFISRDDAGAPLRVTGSMIDVTERRRLHEGQRFLSQASMILDLSLDYEATLPTIARLTVHGIADYCVLHVNPGDGFPGFDAVAHIDPRLQGAVRDAASFLAAGPPTGSLVDRVLRGGDPILLPTVTDEILEEAGLNADMRRAAGDVLPHSAMLVPLRARQAVPGFALFARTVDDRPYDENDLRLAEEVGRRIGLAIDHSRLFHSAQLANRAKADFLSVISHELRTPLTAVLGYADLLGAEIGGPLNETQQRQVSRIQSGSNRLLRLIEGILAFARLEAGSETVRLASVPLRTLIRRAEELVAPSAAEKGVEFRIVVDDAPDRIRTDPEKFGQVLLALLTNAVKFSPDGEVGLRVGQEDERLVLDVTDSGRGIAPEHLPYVFNPFWQAEQPETRRAGGAGLGLSVARRLARLMGGDVLVTRSTSEGTTFRLQLPLHPAR